RVAERFRKQSDWRTTGWSPFSIGLRRSDAAPDTLPFETRPVRAPWMEPGAAIEILSAADDTAGARMFVVPRSMAANGRPDSDSERRRLDQRGTFLHANGARRITAVRVVAPAGALDEATETVESYSPITFAPGKDWCLQVVFDGGRRGVK